MRPSAAGLVAILLGVAGCAAPSVPNLGPTTAPTLPQLAADQLRFSCGTGPTFTADTLSGRAEAERQDNPAAAALRDLIHVRGEPLLPDEDYRLVARTATSVLFVAHAPGSSGWLFVRVDLEGDAWRATAWGDCQPHLALDGLHAATWMLDADRPPKGRSFTALVTERECGGGQPSVGRVLPPLVITGAAAVLVAFAVQPMPEGRLVTCPGNPATPYEVELPEPLGDRELLDAGVFPPRPPDAP